jgi:hypothetical protein
MRPTIRAPGPLRSRPFARCCASRFGTSSEDSTDDIQLLLSDRNASWSCRHERQHAKESGHTVRNIALEKLPEEIDILQAADVWALNEVDWGVKRTNYRK